jgi:glucosamine 6-phosphate synthetase-like amidotransferase/phosphosugar isomerase protein
MSLNGGTSTAHLTRIFESLARISLSFKYASMPEYISGITDRDLVYIFISPSAECLTAFSELRARGFDAYVIVPYFGKEEVAAVGGVFLWNAGEEEVGEGIGRDVDREIDKETDALIDDNAFKSYNVDKFKPPKGR